MINTLTRKEFEKQSPVNFAGFESVIKNTIASSKEAAARSVDIAAAVVPVAFILVTFMLETINPSYSRIQNTISELVWGPNGWGLSVIFFIFGFALMSLALRLCLTSHNFTLKMGITMLFLMGLGFVIIAICPTKAPGAAQTVKSLIHLQTARGISVAFPLACIFFGTGLKNNRDWEFIRIYTLCAGVLGILLAASGAVATITGGEWMGAIERAIVINGLVWLEVLAVHLLFPQFRIHRPAQKIESNMNKWYYLGGYKMKKILLVLAAVLVVIPLVLTSCSPAGPLTTKNYTLTGFTNVQAGNAFQVIVTPSDTFSVAVTAPENRFNNIKVETSGSTLEVTVTGLAFWNIWGGSRPKLEVSMPELDILNLSGASTGTAKGFTSTQNFQLELSGASTADIDIQAFDTSVSISGASKLTGNLAVHDIRLNVSGASSTTITGTGNDLNLQVSGASGAALDNLNVKDARAEISGASHSTVNASGTLDVFLSGASNLTYVGNPTLGTSDITGASSIRQK